MACHGESQGRRYGTGSMRHQETRDDLVLDGALKTQQSLALGRGAGGRVARHDGSGGTGIEWSCSGGIGWRAEHCRGTSMTQERMGAGPTLQRRRKLSRQVYVNYS